MKIAVCGDICLEAANEFWGAVPEVVSVSVHRDVSELAALLGSPDGPNTIVMRLPPAGCDNSEILSAIQSIARTFPVLAWAPDVTAEQAFSLCYLGADGLITDGSTLAERSAALVTVRSRRRGFQSIAASGKEEEPWRRQLVGNSSSMKLVAELVRRVSPRRCTVLITGETGTGKELVARAIHDASGRAAHPMVSINCNAIPAELLEAELFGHVKGAYTGAFSSRLGRFEQASRGTLFLDEIGDLPFSLQAKLLRVLQEREFQRLGSSETVRVDVRVVAATNANLQTLVEQGKFRQDLYYRLNVAPIQLPPLRERLEDIPELVLHFIHKICRNEQIPVKCIPQEIISWLGTFNWPGNIRQLENLVESAIAMSANRSTLRMADFSALLCGSMRQSRLFAMPDEGIDYNHIVGMFEKTLLSEALRLAGGSKKQAAMLLRLKRTTFSAKLDALHVDANEAVLEDDDETAACVAIA
jgi:DNA-binding NtrC family response regulator